MIATRKLGRGDAALWRGLRLEALRTYPAAFLSTHDEAEAVPQDHISEALEHGHTYAVFQGDAAVGIGSLLPHTRAQTAHRGEVGGFFVRPAAQGTGAADALIGAIIDGAQAAGVWQLELYVASSNARARAFYARHGFEETGRIPNAVLVEGHAETDLLLIRAVRPD